MPGTILEGACASTCVQLYVHEYSDNLRQGSVSPYTCTCTCYYISVSHDCNVPYTCTCTCTCAFTCFTLRYLLVSLRSCWSWQTGWARPDPRGWTRKVSRVAQLARAQLSCHGKQRLVSQTFHGVILFNTCTHLEQKGWGNLVGAVVFAFTHLCYFHVMCM